MSSHDNCHSVEQTPKRLIHWKKQWCHHFFGKPDTLALEQWRHLPSKRKTERIWSERGAGFVPGYEELAIDLTLIPNNFLGGWQHRKMLAWGQKSNQPANHSLAKAKKALYKKQTFRKLKKSELWRQSKGDRKVAWSTGKRDSRPMSAIPFLVFKITTETIENNSLENSIEKLCHFLRTQPL